MLELTQLTGKQRQFLQLLQSQDRVPSLRSLCEQHGFDFNFIKGFVLSGALDDYIQREDRAETRWELTPKGQDLDGPLPGVQLAEFLAQGALSLPVLQERLGEKFSVNVGALRKEQAIALHDGDGEKQIQILRPEILSLYAERQAAFGAIAQGETIPDDSPHLDWLQKQSYIVQTVDQDYALTIGRSLKDLDLRPVVTLLTSDLILSDEWRTVELKPYNIHDQVPDVGYGRPAILTQCIQHIRDIFLNMGFDEMSGYIVESAFWNFDALFTPQDHPAREVQDTFYLSEPKQVALPDDAALVERVKATHESTYGGEWKEDEAKRAILRAHTTTSTARKLHQLQGKSGKYFSIDKVFRNETVDRTHLAEFHQIEGVVVGELLSVRTLMGYLTYFYGRLGFEELIFKPTYNPYTEPSLEVLAYHAPSERYIEVGNSGLFRPEMLEPLGCTDRSTVAWGLGLERIAMLLYGVESLSDLIGPEIQIR